MIQPIYIGASPKRSTPIPIIKKDLNPKLNEWLLAKRANHGKYQSQLQNRDNLDLLHVPNQKIKTIYINGKPPKYNKSKDTLFAQTDHFKDFVSTKLNGLTNKYQTDTKKFSQKSEVDEILANETLEEEIEEVDTQKEDNWCDD